MGSMRWGLRSLKFTGGESIELDYGSTLLIVGPNSGGKSTALREIVTFVNDYSQAGLPFPSMRVLARGQVLGEGDDPEELQRWLLRLSNQQYTVPHSISQDTVLQSLWRTYFSGIQTALPPKGFVDYLGVTERLFFGVRTDSIDLNYPVPQQAIHHLQVQPDLLHYVSRQVQSAFGKELIINEAGGPNVWFHVGERPKLFDDETDRSPSYLQRLNLLPQLEQEGDGLRSYVGILLTLSVNRPLMLLVDEPELFLHPPQAQRIAGLLVKYAEDNDRQVIISTHSSAILRGALANSRRVQVCRLTRSGSVNHANVLGSEQLQELWSKPLLRSASAIEGIFYSGVVVCEGDADSRFYEALVRRLEDHSIFSDPIDLYFVSTGGKGELATVAGAYRALKVPVAVVADLDVLRNVSEFKKLLTALGGDFDKVKPLYNDTMVGLGNLGAWTSISDFVTAARTMLDTIEARNEFSTAQREILSELMSGAAKWSVAKKEGINLLREQTRTSAEELLQYCARHGLFLVPVGELESWWHHGVSKKLQWYYDAVDTLVSETSLADSVFLQAYKFVLGVCVYLGMRVSNPVIP